MENIMSSKLFRTRQGTILLGVVAAVLAAIALIVYLNHYKSSAAPATVEVLVAKHAIPQNTSGDVVASAGMYELKPYPQDQVASGAFTQPSQLENTFANTAINPGEQLVASDFGQSSSISTALGRGQRAVVVPLDSPGQVGGQIAAGDSVDVYALISTASGAPVVKEILQNMKVLNTDTDGNVTLIATPKEAGQLIFASGNDKIWLTLRPPRGSLAKSPPITSNNLGG